MGSGPAGDAEGAAGVSTGGSGVCVMCAENMLDEAPVDAVIDMNAIFRVDEEVLITDGAANPGREFRWLAYVHTDPLSFF